MFFFEIASFGRGKKKLAKKKIDKWQFLIQGLWEEAYFTGIATRCKLASGFPYFSFSFLSNKAIASTMMGNKRREAGKCHKFS